jgi:hypothetical protein
MASIIGGETRIEGTVGMLALGHRPIRGIQRVPVEVHKYVTSAFLDERELAMCRGVCKAWSVKAPEKNVVWSFRVVTKTSRKFNVDKVKKYRWAGQRQPEFRSIGRGHFLRVRGPEPLSAEGLALLVKESAEWEEADLDGLDQSQLTQIMDSGAHFGRAKTLTLRLDGRTREDLVDLSGLAERIGTAFPAVEQLTILGCSDLNLAILVSKMSDLVTLNIKNC